MSNILRAEDTVKSFGLLKGSTRHIYPAYGNVYKERYNENKQQHLYGQLDSNKNRNKQNCLMHVTNILKSCDLDFARRIFNLLDPVSLDCSPSDGRKEIAYGIHSAIACGLSVDYDAILKKVNQINSLTYSNPKQATQLKNELVLQIKQTDYIAQMLYAPTMMARAYQKTYNDLKTRLKLSAPECKQLEEYVNSLLTDAVINIHTSTENAEAMINAGKFLMPRDPNAIRHACFTYPQEALNKIFDIVIQKGSVRDVYGSKLAMAKAVIADITNNYNDVTKVPSPNATLEEFKQSAYVCEQEAQEISNNYINNKPTPNVAHPEEIAEQYETHEIMVNDNISTNS